MMRVRVLGKFSIGGIVRGTRSVERRIIREGFSV